MPGPVALTGATGFIGKHLAARLTADGCALQALTRSPQPPAPGIRWILGNLAEPAALSRLVEGVRAVVHCAGAVRGASPAEFNEVNVEGSRRLLQAVLQQPQPPRLLLISSLAAREPALSWYAASKRAAEALLPEYSDRLAWTVLRPPAVYGPGDREILPLLRLLRRGWLPRIGPADARFSLLHVADLASAVSTWLSSPAEPGPFEIDDATPAGYDWPGVRLLAERTWGRKVRELQLPLNLLRGAAWCNLQLARATGRAPMLTPPKLRELTHADWVCDNTALMQYLDWQPRIPLAAALQEPSLAGL